MLHKLGGNEKHGTVHTSLIFYYWCFVAIRHTSGLEKSNGALKIQYIQVLRHVALVLVYQSLFVGMIFVVSLASPLAIAILLENLHKQFQHFQK